VNGGAESSGPKACQGKGVLLIVLALLATVAPGARAAGPADGTTPLLPAATQDTDFLPPDQAFRLNVTAEAHDRVRLSWGIAPGYYLYRARLKFSTTTPNVTLGQADLPPGDTKHDEYFGEQVVYHAGLIARLPVASSAAWTGPLALSVSYQGCAEAGLCYPPITKTFTINMPPLAASGAAPGPGAAAGPGAATSGSEQDGLAQLILGGSMWLVLAKFFGLGLLMAFTPCVLPMVPILSGLIAGQGKHATHARSFALSLAYVLGMATTYTLAGALTAALGLQVQALFQQTWIILLFAAMFVAMALSMFGLYSVQMPAAIQTRLAATSNRQRAGTYGGVAVMGALSALIVTTCVAPPLVATLAVIGQSGDVVRGASALFAMSLGMGAPLLVVGASAGRLLPRAGAWMDTVKQLFGALMLGVAAWMLARLVPERFALLLYAVPLLAAAVVLWRTRSRAPLRLVPRAAALVAGIFAATLCFGAWLGASDPLHPLTRPAATSARALQFRAVATLADLDRAVQSAAASGRAVMLDFYADWCVSCKEMERNTFSDPQVVRALEQLILLRADVTANSAADQALLQRFGIYGPPTIAFYDRAGHEQSAFRVVGYMKPASFAQLLSRLSLPAVAAVVPGG
ncbi:MAG: protein-disulfide reductase DsbD, partial [Steroidobacteraceae bacterium]